MRLWKGHGEVATCGRLLRLTTRDCVLDPRHTFVTVLCNDSSAAVVKSAPFCGCVKTIWDLFPAHFLYPPATAQPTGESREHKP
ncbi:hypothetical protein E2C01_010362 [Portunus trituberculatus]|uniref:Uncharacterized protein n=1 Tax=Portunus trituberculatus TaxID=210409 RepID=A0A5B7D8F3_PORTR|nr:hypothetical protein [Portunus trituberculatus]